MALDLRPLSPNVGVEVLGVDLSGPVSDEMLADMRRAHAEHGLLLFRNQKLTPDQQVEFSRRWGELEIHVLQEFTLPEHPEIFVLTNAKEGGKAKGAHKVGWHWHIDNTYMQNSSLGSLLYAHEVPPEGGDTLFSSLTAAYDGLSDEMKARIDGLNTIHSYQYMWPIKYPEKPPLSAEQKARVPDLVHPLVRVHPETGRKVLYVSEYIIKQVVGWSVEESQKLFAELVSHATRDEFVYRHKWRPHDLLFWDNRGTMHLATPYDDEKHKRLMHTTRIKTEAFKGRVADTAAEEPAAVH